MAKKVEALKIESMNHGQSSEFHSSNIARAEADAFIVEKLGPQLTAWKEANIQFDNYLKQSQKSLMTQDIKELDKQQDDDLKALKGMAKALLNIPDATLKESARRVNLCIDTYKIESDWELIREMSFVKQMLDDLQTRYAADITALGMGLFVDKLRSTNDDLRQAQLQREDESAGNESGQTVAWRRETEKRYREFVEMLNAHILVFGETGYVSFVDKLNASIAHYRQILAVAAGIRAAKKKDEENGGGSGSGSGSGTNSGSTTPVPATDDEPTDEPGDDPGTGGGETPDPGTGGGETPDPGIDPTPDPGTGGDPDDGMDG